MTSRLVLFAACSSLALSSASVCESESCALDEVTSLLQAQVSKHDAVHKLAEPVHHPDHGHAGVEFSTSTADIGHKDEFHFLINGDWGCGLKHPATDSCPSNGTGQMSVAKAMAIDAARSPVDFVINSGDAMYSYGDLTRMDEKFKDTFSDVYINQKSLQKPWWGVLGNHDWRRNASALIFNSTYWKIPSTSYVLRGTAGHVPVNLFFIDTNVMNKGEICWARNRSTWGSLTEKEMEECRGEIQKVFDDQKAWLRDGLAAAKGWRIVIAHEPAFITHQWACTFSPKDYETDCNYLVRELVPILKKGGVHALITGHNHLLSHEQAMGIDQFVVGYGGAEQAGDDSLHYWDNKSSIDVHPVTKAVFANSSMWGYARASLNATHLGMHFTLTSPADPTPHRAYSYYLAGP